MTQAEQLFHQIATVIPEAKASKMFGAQCYKAPNGKALAMYWPVDQAMVFKLQGEDQTDALSLDGAQFFSPDGGRTMGGWVQLPFEYAEKWPVFAQKAYEYVKTITK